MTKPIAWSHTALKDYEGCPRRYHEVRVLKKYPFQETEATRYGNDLHKAVELYIQHQTPIDEKYAFVQPVVDALLKRSGRKMAEQKMAVTVDLKPCDWFAKDTWARGIADLLIIDDENLTAWVADWKTGNNKYPDRDQLRLMSLLVFAHYPHIRKVNSALIFVVKDDMVKAKMEVEEFTPGWQQYRERVAKIEASMSNGVWHPKQTPLCGWCPCTGCEHNPKH